MQIIWRFVAGYYYIQIICRLCQLYGPVGSTVWEAWGSGGSYLGVGGSRQGANVRAIVREHLSVFSRACMLVCRA